MNKLLIIFLILIAVGCAENDILPNDPAGRSDIVCGYSNTWILGCNDFEMHQPSPNEFNMVIHLKPVYTQQYSSATTIYMSIYNLGGENAVTIQWRLSPSDPWNTLAPFVQAGFSVSTTATCWNGTPDKVFTVYTRYLTCNNSLYHSQQSAKIALVSATNGHLVNIEYCRPMYLITRIGGNNCNTYYYNP